MKPSIIFRMGAAHYDCTINNGDGTTTHHDIRAMSPTGRRKFFDAFRAFAQTAYGDQKARRAR